MKKNILFYVFTLFFALASFELSAQKYIEVDDIRYRVIKEADEASTYGTVSVASSEYGEYEGDVVIPNVIKESDDKYADVYKVIGIDDQAFYLANNLESVSLPVSLETIGEDAFRYSSLSSVTIPMGNLSAISDGAFSQTRLTKIEIPSSVKKIGQESFAYCWQLESVKLNEGLEIIGERAFGGCGIVSINLPNSLKSIGNESFSGCKIESIVIPEGIKVIGDGAFSGCIRLHNVKLNNRLKVIGERAFYNCVRLRHIELPEELKEIGEGAFVGSGIIDITIPGSVKEVNNNCFSGSMIRSIRWNGNTQLIDPSADEKQAIREKNITNNLSKLMKQSIKYGDLQISWREYNGMVYIIDGIEYSPLQYPYGDERYGLISVVKGNDAKGEIVIPDIVEIIGGPYEEKYIVNTISAAAFDGQSLIKHITLPTTIESIGISAFRNTGITDITIPQSLTAIPSGLFSKCKNLKSVSLPSSISKIESFAFSESGLTSIIIPFGVDTIDNNAFEKCNHLSTLQLPTSLKVLGKRCFTECPISELKLPESLEEIGHSCFSRCQLTSITIPSAVKSIDDRAFSCETLTNVTILGDPSSWEGWYVFGNNDNLQISVTHKISNGKLLKDYGNKIKQP